MEQRRTERLQQLGIEPLSPDQKPVEEAYVQRLEAKIGVALPDAYRDFLCRYGTCTSSHELIYRVTGDWLAGTDIFFGADDSGAYDIIEHWEAYHDRMPPALVPIATDPGGDLVCLGVRGEQRGKVFFWDEENEGPVGAPWWDNVYQVADSLADFFDRLEIEPEDP